MTATDWYDSGVGAAVRLLGDTMPESVREDPGSPARFAMAQHLRQLNQLVLEAAAPAEDFERAAGLLFRAQKLLTAAPKRVPHRWEASALTGKFNALAPPIEARPGRNPSVFRIATTLPTGFGGPDGLVHGGVVAKIMDMCFGAAGGLNGTPGMTGTLTVRYERPTPLDRELVFESWVDRVEGRKVFVAGHVLHDRTRTVTATGIMIRGVSQS